MKAQSSFVEARAPVVAWGLALSLGACATYEPRPLDPAATLETVEHRRSAPAPATAAIENGVPFVTLAAWLRTQGPGVLEAVAAYRTAVARADVATPLQNPSLEIGPQFGFGPDVGSVNAVQPIGSLAIALPTGSRRADQDALNRARAESARTEAVLRHRELYLELRRQWTRMRIAAAREESRREIAASAAKTLDTLKRLVEAGAATALDVAMFQLEASRARIDQIDAGMELERAKFALAGLCGVHPRLLETLAEEPLPSLPAQVPPIEVLRSSLLANHAGLGRLRQHYAVAECVLRLEIARQYPDLRIGTGLEGETGERKYVLGLLLGVELPIFDRNQQAIAEASSGREEIRVRYEAAASRALAELERDQRDLELARQKRRLIVESILEPARAGIDLARESLVAGAGDALRLLDSQRMFRRIRIEALEAQLEELRAWITLEEAVGRPLLRFPHEPGARDPAGVEGPQAEQPR